MRGEAAFRLRFGCTQNKTLLRVGGQTLLIRSIIPPHLQGPDFDFSDKFKTLNIYKFSRQFCASVFKQLLGYYTKAIDDNCYYELILGILIYVGQAQIHAEVLDGEVWAELDDPNDLRVAEFVFDRPARAAIIEESFGGLWAHNVLDFGFIRNMHFPPSAMLAEMKGNLPNLLHNYGSRRVSEAHRGPDHLSRRDRHRSRSDRGRGRRRGHRGRGQPQQPNGLDGADQLAR